MKILQRFWLVPLLLGVSAMATSTVEAQVPQPPPNNGFNATIALPSTIVAVRYAVKGIQASPDWQPNGANINEGRVTRVDRGRKQITIEYANGGTETLHSDNSFTAHSSRVIVYYADESGRQVTRFFKPAH